MTAPRCDGCRFYAPPAVAVPEGLGDCRRLPPVVAVVETLSTEFPLVAADCWCGEHRPIRPDAKPAWEKLWEKAEK